MFSSYTIEEARKIITDNISCNLGLELANIENSIGRILAKDIISGCNVPGFKRSIMDGYAVRAADLAGASQDNPVSLSLVGEIEMGREATVEVKEGECAYIPTGGMLPKGADSVLMIENTKKDNNKLLAYNKTVLGENIVSENEDVSLGEVVLKAGKKVRPYEMGVMSSIGYTNIEVYKKPRVGILSTGDELVSPYETPKLGQVRDINTYLMYGLITEMGCTPVVYKVKTDDYQGIFEAVKNAVNECDTILISGGSSVGVKDYTRRVLEGMENSKILVHGLALKPGKPTIIAKCDDKIVFGMPGHPLSCAVVFKTLVKFYLNSLMNYCEEEYPVVCKLSRSYRKTKGREEYIPVVIDGEGSGFAATPITGKSGIITTFSKSYGYFRTDKTQDNVLEGDLVEVYKL